MAKFILDGQEYGGGSCGSNVIKLTQAEYDALPNDKLSDDNIYLITDSGELTAENLFYDDTETGLGVNNVQDAIVEQNKNLKSKIEFEYVVKETSATPFSVSHTITEDGLYHVSMGFQKYSETNSNEYISVSNGIRYGWNSSGASVSTHISAFLQLKQGDIVTVGSNIGTSCSGDYLTLVQIVKI